MNAQKRNVIYLEIKQSYFMAETRKEFTERLLVSQIMGCSHPCYSPDAFKLV